MEPTNPQTSAQDTRPSVAAIVVAAGRGSRAGLAAPKQYAALAGETVLRRTLQVLEAQESIDLILTVIHPDDSAAYAQAALGLTKLVGPAPGGATRQDSVRAGLEALQSHAPDYVLVHDAARPFVSRDLLDRIVAALRPDTGIIPALPIAETLKRVQDNLVTETVPRQQLHAVQTPQAFPFRALLDAHRRAAAEGAADLTDDASVVALAGMPVAIVPGERANLKLTTPDDFSHAAHMLAASFETRTAQGFDVHAFGPGDSVMLCGVRVPHSQGLVGHSDADVGLHALTDAVLGAIAEGDIGEHFPPTDERWKGMASEHFLREAADRVRRRGGRILNLDVTLVCEAPRIGPHRDAMRAAVAAAAGVSPERVAVKATTSERLGFTGRREGMAALALATIELPRAADDV